MITFPYLVAVSLDIETLTAATHHNKGVVWFGFKAYTLFTDKIITNSSFVSNSMQRGWLKRFSQAQTESIPIRHCEICTLDTDSYQTSAGCRCLLYPIASNLIPSQKQTFYSIVSIFRTFCQYQRDALDGLVTKNGPTTVMLGRIKAP